MSKEGFVVSCQEYWVDGDLVYYLYLNLPSKNKHQAEMIRYGTPPTKSFSILASPQEYAQLQQDGYIKINKRAPL